MAAKELEERGGQHNVPSPQANNLVGTNTHEMQKAVPSKDKNKGKEIDTAEAVKDP